MTSPEKGQEDEEDRSGPVVHGGKEDPLGGGVADLKESTDVTEGVPDQEDGSTDKQ